MSLWELSVRRPIFMSSILAAIIVIGLFSLNRLPVELFPDITFPIVKVQTIYPGAAPNEIETLVSKPIEEELSGIAGVKVVRSINRESVSVVVAEFNLDVDIKYAEQQVRDKVSGVKNKLPDDIDEPVITKIDPSAQPILTVAVKTDLKGGKLYDLINEVIRPKFEQVGQVGRVDVVGVRKREIQVQLDRNQLNRREISAQQIVQALQKSGENIPAGKLSAAASEKVYRTLGEFESLQQISDSLVSFFANDATTRVRDVGSVVDTLEDEKVRAFVNGESAALIYIYKQSGANTIAVSNALYKAIDKMNAEALRIAKLSAKDGEEVKAQYSVEKILDMSKFIRANVIDVVESIAIGILLTIIVVFLFLGSFRSTIITGFALPVSLIGGLMFLDLADLSINMMTLLGFSLSVGLLIDDAIVVRENIFRHLQMGKSPVRAAIDGTREVAMAVVAVTLAIISVFGPIAFLSGVVGQFFKSFGLAICFVMIVSLFDALTNASMLSAYFGGGHVDISKAQYSLKHPILSLLKAFEVLQLRIEHRYAKTLEFVLRHPIFTLAGTMVGVVLLAASVAFIPKTFLPPQDSGEFNVQLDIKPGSSLDAMAAVALKIDQEIRQNPEVSRTSLTVGDLNGRSYYSSFYVILKPFGERTKKTSAVKDEIRELLKKYPEANPKVTDIDFVGAGQRPFVVSIRGQNLEELRLVAQKLFDKLKTHPALQDPDITDKPGLPEFQVDLDKQRALQYGVTPSIVGVELRTHIEGLTPAKFRENGIEYDIRVRLKDDQRNLEQAFYDTKVPNINYRMVRLADFAKPKNEIGFATINREDRGRYIAIEADVAPTGPGMGGVIQDIDRWISTGEVELPPGVSYRYVGQAENFQELLVSIKMAGLLAIVFMYLILASLYESVVTPFTIMLVIPLAIFGGFFGLFVMQSSLDLFSMIGCIILMGLATKNSIIMVDYINQKIDEGLELKAAILEAGRARLRPIIMTSLALMAGMLPVAYGLNEASSQRKSLGIAVIGGVAVSTLLTLIVIPAVFTFIENGRRWMIKNVGSKLINSAGEEKSA